MKIKPNRNIALAFLLTLGTSLGLRGQSAPANSSGLSNEVIEMEAFTINTDRDVGYVAVDSLAGGRNNVEIKYTPASMSSLTRAFIDDLGIQNVRESLRWTPNIVPASPDAGKGFGGSAFHDWSINYRGAGAGQQGGPGPTRNYFSFYQNADTYNIERIEFLRGPNSLVFGLGTVGGTLSTYTKIPRMDKDFITTTGIADSNGSVRFEFDWNQRLTDQVSMRINAVNDNNQGWRDNDYNKLRAITLALMYRPSEKTSFRLEGEVARKHRSLISTTIGDKLSGWDGTTASQAWGVAPTGPARVDPIQNAGAWGDWLNQFWVWNPSLQSNQLQRWAGGYASTTALEDKGAVLNFQPYAGFYPDQIKLPWHSAYSSTAAIPVIPFRAWTYGNGQSDVDYSDVTAWVNHQFSDSLEASLSVYRYDDDQTAKDYEGTGGAAIDINKQLPDGSPNPNFGKAFADSFLSKQLQSRSVTEARLQVNYDFDFTFMGQRWNQLFSGSVARKEVDITARQNLGQIGNSTTLVNPADWVQNMVWGRVYLDNPNQIMAAPDVASNGQIITYAPKADGYWFDFDDNFKLQDIALMSHSRLFDDKLSILAGARYDSYDEDIRELRRGPNLTDKLSSESQSGTTYSAGAVYYFNWLGVFANYSENIHPPNPGSQPLLNRERPNPENGTGLDFGLRVSTGDGKYYASLSRYDTKSEGHLVENPIGLRGIWQRYFDAQPSLPRDQSLNDLAYSDTTARDVTGYEFEIVANPTPNLRLQASYAKPDATIVDYYPGARAYFAENLAKWNQGITNADTSDHANALRGEIANVQNSLDQALPGAIETGFVDYTASLFAHYSFLDGRMKGLSLGAGVNHTGKRYAGVFDKVQYWGDSVTSTSAVVSYKMKLFGETDVRFSLNVENVLGDEDPIITDYHWGYTGTDGVHIPSGYYFNAPRTFRFTAQFTF